MEKPGKVTYTLSTLSMLNQFHTEGKYCDVQLRVGTKLFKCQRSLLAAASEYFDTMFSSDFRESNATIDEPITLLGMDAIAFEKMLHFMYTGDISINDSNVLQMLFMNDFLRLRTTHVKEECIKHLKNRSEEHEPISNAFELLSFAYTKAENKLVDTLSAHICQHLHYYSKDAQLLEISFDSLNALLKFSKNYILSLSGSQNVVLKIIHSWINHDRKRRGECRCKLMKHINFSNISSDFTLLLINELEKMADEVVNPRDIKPPSQRKTFGMEMLVDGDSRFEASITLFVRDLREMESNEIVFSPPSIICNLSWKVGVKRCENDGYDYLNVYLYCDGTSKASIWKCYAKSTFTLVSRKKDRKNYVQECRSHIFSSNKPNHGFGFKKFILWDSLNDQKNGYIEDNSFLLRTHVYADVPFCPNQSE